LFFLSFINYTEKRGRAKVYIFS